MNRFTISMATLAILVSAVACNPVGKKMGSAPDTLVKPETTKEGLEGSIECRSRRGFKYEAIQIHVNTEARPETQISEQGLATTLQKDVEFSVIQSEKSGIQSQFQTRADIKRFFGENAVLQRIEILSNQNTVVNKDDSEVKMGEGVVLASFQRNLDGRTFSRSSQLGIAGLSSNTFECREFEVNYQKPNVGENFDPYGMFR